VYRDSQCSVDMARSRCRRLHRAVQSTEVVGCHIAARVDEFPRARKTSNILTTDPTATNRRQLPSYAQQNVVLLMTVYNMMCNSV